MSYGDKCGAAGRATVHPYLNLSDALEEESEAFVKVLRLLEEVNKWSC